MRLDSTTRRHFHSALLLLTENPIQNRTLMLLLLLGLAPTRDGPVNSLYLSVCVDIVRYFWKTEAHGQAAPSLFLGPNPIFFVQYPDVRYLYDTFLVYFAVYFFLKCVLLFCFVFGADKSWSSALPPERSNAGVTKTWDKLQYVNIYAFIHAFLIFLNDFCTPIERKGVRKCQADVFLLRLVALPTKVNF